MGVTDLGALCAGLRVFTCYQIFVNYTNGKSSPLFVFNSVGHRDHHHLLLLRESGCQLISKFEFLFLSVFFLLFFPSVFFLLFFLSLAFLFFLYIAFSNMYF